MKTTVLRQCFVRALMPSTPALPVVAANPTGVRAHVGNMCGARNSEIGYAAIGVAGVPGLCQRAGISSKGAQHTSM